MIGESLIPQQLDVGASPAFVGLTLTGLTTGYVPYKSATTLANSPIFISTTNVGIGVTVPIASALLDLTSTTKALLLTRRADR